MRHDFFHPLIETAIELAAQWHASTFRKGVWRKPPFLSPEGDQPPIPVMAHVTTVGLTVQRAGWNASVVAAAFLHDILEDPNLYGDYFELSDLQRSVGEEVAGLVQQVTEEKFETDGTPRTWKERKERYVAALRRQSPEAAAISLADKMHNLWSMNESLDRGIDVFSTSTRRQKLGAGPVEQLWFHRSVLEATYHHTDPRLPVMQFELDQEIKRFEAQALRMLE
jgi:(p)ppGpp synthase/HD superfamily hydrolase